MGYYGFVWPIAWDLQRPAGAGMSFLSSCPMIDPCQFVT
jgi:hypothetical protein